MAFNSCIIFYLYHGIFGQKKCDADTRATQQLSGLKIILSPIFKKVIVAPRAKRKSKPPEALKAFFGGGRASREL